MGFYDIRIPQTQKVKLLTYVNHLKNYISEIGSSGYFADNLITIGRNMGFMQDEKFRNSLNSSLIDPDDINKTWRLHVYSWAIRSALEIEGDFVECGVYRGLYVKTAVKYLEEIIKDKTFYLYDTFSGLDKRYSSKFEQKLSETGTFDMPGLETEVRKEFDNFSWIKVIRGSVPDILKINSPDKISFLHLDLNAGDAETKALDILFERVTEGGIILLDDYGRLEHNELFVTHNKWFSKKGYRVLEIPTGQGMVIKRKMINLDEKIKCADLKSAH
ncbi:MAG: methyltransferase [Rhodospirillaceae bacterium]|nr:methyltransferase [Rhodospirillaceae bacterium]|tara:strand:+ start:397 stop:1218 length:822 start_codon:yes stop_codon:yes gene_type:complete